MRCIWSRHMFSSLTQTPCSDWQLHMPFSTSGLSHSRLSSSIYTTSKEAYPASHSSASSLALSSPTLPTCSISSSTSGPSLPVSTSMCHLRSTSDCPALQASSSLSPYSCSAGLRDRACTGSSRLSVLVCICQASTCFSRARSSTCLSRTRNTQLAYSPVTTSSGHPLRPPSRKYQQLWRIMSISQVRILLTRKNFCRLFGRAFFHRLGLGGGSSLLAGLAILMLPAMWSLFFWGAKLRAMSKYTQK